MKMASMNTGSEPSCAPCGEYDPSPCVYLNDDQVEALGIKGMPAPGTVFTLQARAVVTRVSAEAEEADETATEGKQPDVCLTLKLTDMGVATASAGDGERATMLYGGA